MSAEVVEPIVTGIVGVCCIASLCFLAWINR